MDGMTCDPSLGDRHDLFEWSVDVQLTGDFEKAYSVGDNRNVIEDLLKFLKGQLAPRPGLSKVPLGTLAYWQMVPGN